MPPSTIPAASRSKSADNQLSSDIRDRLNDPSIRVSVPVINSVYEAAVILNISRRKIDSLIAEGKLKVLRIGRHIKVTREALEKFTGCKLA